MDKVLDKYHDLRKVLGPFNEGLEEQWQRTRRLNPEIARLEKEQSKAAETAEKLAETLKSVNQKMADKAVTHFMRAQRQLWKEADEVNERLMTQRHRLLNIPTADAIRDFGELTQTWAGLNDEVKQGDVLERYGELLLAASESGHKLDAAQLAIVDSMQEATKTASGYDLALAELPGRWAGPRPGAQPRHCDARAQQGAGRGRHWRAGKQRLNLPRWRKARAFWLSVSRPSVMR